jgi:anti-sigma factor RsiW
MTDHLVYEEAVAAYLLDALPDDELRDFEAHLQSCDRCRAEVASLRIASDALSASAPPVAPPSELKDRIMQVVRSEAELLQAAGDRADRPPRRRRLRFPGVWRLPAVAWAAAGILLVAGGIVGFALHSSSGREVKTIRAQVSAPSARASLRMDGSAATLRVRGLRNPSSGRVYEVWLKRPGRPPAPTDALFTVSRGGTASVQVPGAVHGGDQVLVTSEPRGGSRTPTTQPIISVTT